MNKTDLFDLFIYLEIYINLFFKIINYKYIKKILRRRKILTFEYRNKLDSVIEGCWKFKALDVLEISDEFTNDEKHKIMEHLFINKNKVKQTKGVEIESSNKKKFILRTQFLK